MRNINLYLVLLVLIIYQEALSQTEIKKSYVHSRTLLTNGEFKNALLVCDSILTALSKNESNEYYGKTLLNKQIIYVNISDYRESIEVGNVAFINFLENKNVLGQSKVASNLAQAYCLAGDKVNAVKYGKIAIELINQLPNKENLANQYNSLAIIYEENGDTLTALNYYHKGLAVAKTDKDSINSYFNIRSNLVDIYLRKRYFDSVSRLIEMNELLIKKHNKEFNAQHYYTLDRVKFELFYAKKEYQQALRILYKNYEYIQTSEDLYEKRYYYENLYLTYKSLNEKDSALRYLEKYSKVLADTKINENELEITKLSFDLDLKKEQALNEQKINYEKKIKTYIILLSGVILLIVVVFLIIVFKNLQKQKLLTKKVENQAEELKEKQKEILDSIHYAKRIQMAIMPNLTLIRKHLNK
ncbi:MAG: tetratricopeptide repeat protein [Bacteroidota bacterium]